MLMEVTVIDGFNGRKSISGVCWNDVTERKNEETTKVSSGGK